MISWGNKFSASATSQRLIRGVSPSTFVSTPYFTPRLNVSTVPAGIDRLPLSPRAHPAILRASHWRLCALSGLHAMALTMSACPPSITAMGAPNTAGDEAGS